MLGDGIIREARITPCGTYRYTLDRCWDDSKNILIVCMVNPSTADHTVDDPTIQRIMRFAGRWGFGGVRVVNLFGLRSSHPSALDTHTNPVGPENEPALREALFMAKVHVGWVLVAWGNNGVRHNRDRQFIQLAQEVGVEMRCLGVTKDGFPKHPLARGQHRVPDDFQPVPFTLDLRSRPTVRPR